MSQPVFFPHPKAWTPAKGVCTSLVELTLNEFWLDAHLDPSLNPEGYALQITPTGIYLRLGSDRALHYAWLHFEQWRKPSPEAIPCGEVKDHPTFPRRGFMLDISRCKVPTRESLEEWVHLLADFRYNELQLYTEHTFAYKGHRPVWEHASPLDKEDILWLQSLCQSYSIELVPNQNCFGHFERWIGHSDYRKYAETPDGFITPWGEHRHVGSVLKPDQASYDLVTGLLDEILPLFESPLINIGCDETFELGQGASKERCKKEGFGKVYTEFVSRIMKHVSEKHGKRAQFWGDIILKSPEELRQFPKDAIALEWGYEADHPFDADSKLFKESGLDFVVCPGSSSWQSFAGRTENMFVNIRKATEAAQENEALGLLLTDWGDFGHLQQNPVTYPALAWCGLNAWAQETASIETATLWCDEVAFKNNSGDTDAWLAAGRVSDLLEKPTHNSSPLFQLFRNPEETRPLLPIEKIKNCLEAVDNLQAPSMYTKEWEQTLRNLRLPLLRALGRKEADECHRLSIEGHEKLWRQRNREGGLAESVSMYSSMARDLKTGDKDE